MASGGVLAEPQALHGLGRARVAQDPAGNQLPFVVGVGGDHDAGHVRAGEQIADDVQLVLAVGRGGHAKRGRQHRPGRPLPALPSGVVRFGFGQGQQVAEAPGDEVIARGEIAGVAGGAAGWAQRRREIAAHAGLLDQDQGLGVGCHDRITSSTNGWAGRYMPTDRPTLASGPEWPTPPQGSHSSALFRHNPGTQALFSYTALNWQEPILTVANRPEQRGARSLFGNSEAAPGLRCRGCGTKRSPTKGWQRTGMWSQIDEIPRIGLTNANASRDSDDWYSLPDP